MTEEMFCDSLCGMTKQLYSEVTDARDGLTPFLRQILSILQTLLAEDSFRKSTTLAQTVADMLGTDADVIYDMLVDTTWPRCNLPLIHGLGNFGFPPAASCFSEMNLSGFFRSIEDIRDFRQPLIMPVPYALIAGTFGYYNAATKLPSHNLAEVIDATIALIKNPHIDTRELLQFIKGPDLLVGGVIENAEDLCSIYAAGSGIIKVRVSPENINANFFDNSMHYCDWYGMISRKIRLKEERRISVNYNALLNDGSQTRLMPLKAILQCYLDYFRSAKKDLSDEALCDSLLSFKKYSSSRQTQIAF